MRRPWGWVLFFVVLTGLSVIAVVLPIAYNLGQQLRPDMLEDAHRRWDEKGPADYDLTFNVYVDRDRQPLRHVVMVRGGVVVFAACEGEPVQFAPELAGVVGLPLAGVGKSRAYTVPLLFDHLRKLLDDEGEDRRNFLIAVFDPQTGWPRRFIRRVRGTPVREEWNLKLWKLGELDEQARRYK